MKNYNLNSTRNINFSKTIEYPFVENEILYLHEIFLTNGIHSFNVKTIDLGRKIIYSILNSLQFYQNIACLTLSEISLNNDITNIYGILNDSNFLNDPNKDLVSFFLDEFYYDFIWIEENNKLKKSEWYKLFNQYLIDLNFNRSIPIILISYN